MYTRLLQQAIFTLLIAFTFSSVWAQKVQEPATNHPEWSKPYQPFRIVGNLYYVGTYDLACYLIATTQGSILINTGLAASSTQIRSNIEKLGFKFSDIKILLTTQAHFDHLGAMAAIKKATGAQFMVNAAEAAVVADGGISDYELGVHGRIFEPIVPDKLLQDGDTIRLGDVKLVMLHHPGHTKGSSSYWFQTKDDKRSYRVLIANMPTIITEKRFEAIGAYPHIANDYAYTLDAMKKVDFDLWVASHASQFGLHRKRQPGGRYNPVAFMDRAAYNQSLAALRKQYKEHLDKK